MIKIREGKNGSGKSLATAEDVFKEFMINERDIVTSHPVKVFPWVTRKGKSYMGFRHYMERFVPPGHDFRQLEYKLLRGTEREPLIEAFGHLLIVRDPVEQGQLFRWRRDVSTGEWFRLSYEPSKREDGKPGPPTFDQSEVDRCRGCLVANDEAWFCYGARQWQQFEQITMFYKQQHRKFGDDWLLITPSLQELDKAIRVCGQEFESLINHGHRRFGLFRLPRAIEIRTYYSQPGSNAARHCVTAFRRIDPLLVQTYDTSAGIGVGGGGAADAGRRPKGIPWQVAVVGLFTLLVLLWVGRDWPDRLVRYFFTAHTAVGKPLASTGSNSVVNAAVSGLGSVTAGALGLSAVPSRSVDLGHVDGKRGDNSTAYAGLRIEAVLINPDFTNVVLSDGTIYGSDEIEHLYRNRVEIDGHWFRTQHLAPAAKKVDEPLLEPDTNDVPDGSGFGERRPQLWNNFSANNPQRYISNSRLQQFSPNTAVPASPAQR